MVFPPTCSGVHYGDRSRKLQPHVRQFFQAKALCTLAPQGFGQICPRLSKSVLRFSQHSRSLFRKRYARPTPTTHATHATQTMKPNHRQPATSIPPTAIAVLQDPARWTASAIRPAAKVTPAKKAAILMAVPLTRTPRHEQDQPYRPPHAHLHGPHADRRAALELVAVTATADRAECRRARCR